MIATAFPEDEGPQGPYPNYKEDPAYRATLVNLHDALMNAMEDLDFIGVPYEQAVKDLFRSLHNTIALDERSLEQETLRWTDMGNSEA